MKIKSLHYTYIVVFRGSKVLFRKFYLEIKRLKNQEEKKINMFLT